jgi:hypothetical protein
MQHYQRKMNGLGSGFLRILGLQGDALFLEGETDPVREAEVIHPVAGLGEMRGQFHDGVPEKAGHLSGTPVA